MRETLGSKSRPRRLFSDPTGGRPTLFKPAVNNITGMLIIYEYPCCNRIHSANYGRYTNVKSTREGVSAEAVEHPQPCLSMQISRLLPFRVVDLRPVRETIARELIKVV